MEFIWGAEEQAYFLNTKDKNERTTALTNAFIYKDWKAFDWMVAQGARPNDASYEMLWTAVQRQDLDAVKKLIAYGCDVHRVSDVAFRDAIRLNNVEIAKVLKEAGADIRANNDEAMSSAAENGQVHTIRMLCTWGMPAVGFNNDPLLRASDNGHFDAVKELVRLGAPVGDELGNHLPLRAAIKQNHAKMGAFILSRIANIQEVLEQLEESDAYLPDDWKLRIEHWRLTASIKE